MSNQDLKQERKVLEKIIRTRYKKSIWESFKEFLGVFLVSIFLLICITVVLILGVYLIENPISLAILCGTILLIIIWRLK